MQRAGLCQIEWRPWFIPHTMLDPHAYSLRRRVEDRPNLSLLLLVTAIALNNMIAKPV